MCLSEMPEKFSTRKIILLDDARRRLAVAMVENAPLGIEVIAREPVKARSQQQNALMWASALNQIAEQAWVEGRKYAAEVWHEHCKRQFLPETTDPDLPRLVKDADKWRKWDYLPDGERVLVGSTTQLSVYGMQQYMDQVYAMGAAMGVLFEVVER
jgi:hypothetical protein